MGLRSRGRRGAAAAAVAHVSFFAGGGRDAVFPRQVHSRAGARARHSLYRTGVFSGDVWRRDPWLYLRIPRTDPDWRNRGRRGRRSLRAPSLQVQQAPQPQPLTPRAHVHWNRAATRPFVAVTRQCHSRKRSPPCACGSSPSPPLRACGVALGVELVFRRAHAATAVIPSPAGLWTGARNLLLYLELLEL